MKLVYNKYAKTQNFEDTKTIEIEKAAVMEMKEWCENQCGSHGVRSGTVAEVLTRPKEPIVVRGALLKYTVEADESCARDINSWAELSRRLTAGNEKVDEVFPHTTRWESVYLPIAWVEPENVEYLTALNPFLPFEQICDPVMLANSEFAFTPWHADTEPPLTVLSQLYRGWKVWPLVPSGGLQRELCKDSKTKASELLDHLKSGTIPADVKVYLQKPDEVLYLSPLAAHAVVSNPGFTKMLTWQLKEDEVREAVLKWKAVSVSGGKKKQWALVNSQKTKKLSGGRSKQAKPSTNEANEKRGRVGERE